MSASRNHTTAYFLYKKACSSAAIGKRSRIANRIAIIGTTISIAVVILTFSIVNGFQSELKQKLYSFNSTFSIYPSTIGNDTITEEELLASLRQKLPNADIYRSFFMPSLIKSVDNFDNLILTSHSSELKINDLTKYRKDGKNIKELSGNEAVISSTTSEKLNVGIDDEVDLVIPFNGGLKLRKLRIAGIYETHFNDYDRNIAYASGDFISKIIKSTPKSVEKICIDIRSIDNSDLKKTQHIIEDILQNRTVSSPINYQITSINEEAANYFAWLYLLDTNSVVIVVLMTFISLFTLISSNVIVILEHVNLIGLLKILGAKSYTIKKVFIMNGLKLLFQSLIISNIISFLLILTQNHFHFIPLNPADYYLSEVPMNLNFMQFIIIDIFAFIVSFISLLIPVIIISKISPIKTIKYS